MYQKYPSDKPSGMSAMQGVTKTPQPEMNAEVGWWRGPARNRKYEGTPPW